MGVGFSFVALVNPPSPGQDVFAREGRCQERLGGKLAAYPPLSLATTASVLRAHGVPCGTFDLEADRGLAGSLEAALASADDPLVVLNTTTPTIAADMAFAQGIRERHPGTALSAMGVHVTAIPSATLRLFPHLDSVVVGEPEMTVLALARARGGARLPGTVSRGGGGVMVDGGRRPFIDELDAMPFPDWGGLPRTRYVLPLFSEPYLMVQTSRGCPHRCTFCVSHLWYGRRPRLRSPTSIIDEIERDVDLFGTRLFYLFGDTVTLQRDQMLGVCRGIIERDLDVRWLCNSRVDAVDAELLDAMSTAGCAAISFGIESADPNILNAVRKGITPEQTAETVALTRDRGILTIGFFVLGLPGETSDTIDSTIDFARDLPLDLAEFYPAVPYPGTELERQLLGGPQEEGDWAGYEYGTPLATIDGMDPDELTVACKRAYRRFYSRPERLGRLASRITDPGIVAAGARFVRQRFL